MQSTNVRNTLLIETQELEDLVTSGADIQIVNATWYLPNVKKDARAEHNASRITLDTQFFDIDGISDTSSPLPHTLPSVEFFIENMKKLNIQSNLPIICYDNSGIFSVARAAWMFRYFGASNVRVLNGGFKKWVHEHRKTASGT